MLVDEQKPWDQINPQKSNIICAIKLLAILEENEVTSATSASNSINLPIAWYVEDSHLETEASQMEGAWRIQCVDSAPSVTVVLDRERHFVC